MAGPDLRASYSLVNTQLIGHFFEAAGVSLALTLYALTVGDKVPEKCANDWVNNGGRVAVRAPALPRLRTLFRLT